MGGNLNLVVLSAALLVGALLVSASVFYSSNNLVSALNGLTLSANSGQPAPIPAARQLGAASAKPGGKIDLSAASFLGSKDALFSIVEYSDFQCPFCRKFYADTKSELVKNLVDSGKTKFVYKHFPLDSIHPGARPAAVAFECSKDQGKEWEFHDEIFVEQSKLGQGTVDLSAAMINRVAASIGLDKAKFDSCVSSGSKNNVVESDLQEGAENGITGTPGFLIADAQGNVITLISGAQPYSAFKRAFDALPAK